MSKKRGVIEVQFNWIFILIIGGLILVFFLGVVRTQKKVAETKISVTISTDLRAILSGVEVSTQTASLIDIPKTEIEYDCLGYSVGGVAGMRPIASFSPNIIKGNNLLSWTLPWSVPYRVMNFIYLTSPEVRYIIVDDDDADPGSLANELNESLPENYVIEDGQEKLLMNKELITISDWVSNRDTEIIDKNHYKVRLIFFGTDLLDALNKDTPNELAQLGEDLTAISVLPSPGLGLDGHGEITFYKQGSLDEFEEDSTTYYLGKASLIAAIFAEDIESYNCNMQRAFKKFGFITDIYLKRTIELKDYYYYESINPSCESTYSSAKPKLEDIKDKTVILSEELNPTDIENIYNEISSIVNENDKAQKLSCPEIY